MNFRLTDEPVQSIVGVKPRVDLLARAELLRFEAEVGKLPQVRFPLQHHFVDGLYVRELFIPAGGVIVGHIHMQPCITTVSLGSIAIKTDGDQVRILTAPATVSFPAGSKKAGFALEETVWTDAYANPDNEQDIEKLEAKLIAHSHAEFIERSAPPEAV